LQKFTQRDLLKSHFPFQFQAVRRCPFARRPEKPKQHGVLSMKKTLATTAALLAFLGTAYAATVQGTIQAVDPTTKSITLDDGKIYQLSPKASVGKFKVGAKVAVTVDDKTGMVTSIKKAS